MAVVREFTLPDLGEGLTEAEIVRWLVEVGEVVAVDQPVVEVETAKAVVEVPCPYGGVVTARFGAEGDTLDVGKPLVTVAVGSGAGSGPDTDLDTGSTTNSETSSTTGAGPGGTGAAADEGSGNVLVGYGTGTAVARRRGRVRAMVSAVGTAETAPAPVTARAADGTGAVALAPGNSPAPGGGTPDVQDGPVAVISPLVRRLAREHGLDLRALAGTGPDGLILRADVERALAAPDTAPAPEPSAGAAAAVQGSPVEGGERVPLRGVRGMVADKLARSRREIPDATCWVDADATELLAARAAMNAAGGERISVLALFARIVTAGLARYPELNATVDTERHEIVRLPAVHLGFAAQTERGLVVPVVRDAHTRTTAALSAEIGRLTEAARTGSLTPAELTGGTFTLNNYGVFGVDGSTPIINHPEAAMLGIGRIAPKPWVKDGELAVRHVVQLSFTFDHRVCDGGTAGGFLRFVADCVESPAVLLTAV
ncbi:pyruvate dehydrogenase E2 component (dihydrolipoamide acetyltransferase) [Actinacidiphila alni]|uniref:Dihydrolipoamide acetyltransferase component of pyruvate dehydrogenase complex n=1 Tax=Actinacidiphila alni TaxID=380248 RepID=A0A1I1YWZ1_9ACTN|nr:dihydrolipoamide acetyltransferase family protein [Actinacidiphila alni]SFE23508.1 pyruvate dehydrogenase E2 component (dihydrolipoamide acetyltransferase) [Actinacidiphila alni]